MIKLYFSTKGTGKFKGKFTLVAYNPDATTPRTYSLAKSLFPFQLPNLETWDNKTRRFANTTAIGKIFNETCASIINDLSEIAHKYKLTRAADIIKQYKIDHFNAKKLFDIGETKEKSQQEIPTFEEYLFLVIEREKNKSRGCSTNYQRYITLRNKLIGVNNKMRTSHQRPLYAGFPIAETLVTEITNDHFAAFGEWIYGYCNGDGYRNLMTNFKSAYRRAAREYSISTVLNFDWVGAGRQLENRIEIPVDAQDVLSIEEVEQFENFDLSTISTTPKGGISFELTRDVLLLQYYTFSRPADVILFREYDKPTKTMPSHSFNISKGKFMYIPYKMRNRGGSVVYGSLKKGLIMDIIERNRGLSKGGYILPLPMLSTDWGTPKDMNVEVFKKYESAKKQTLRALNDNLKVIFRAMGWETIDNISGYLFRHSAITHLVDNGVAPIDVARLSGTSAAMIEKHYYRKDATDKLFS